MTSHVSQSAENFDSTAKLVTDALAKAGAELEKSVAAFSEQLISFNESLQKALDEELHAVNARMEASIKSNLDELSHNKHLLAKRLMDSERQELESLAGTGKQVRSSLNDHALSIEEKIEEFVSTQIDELKSFLAEPKQAIEDASAGVSGSLSLSGSDCVSDIKRNEDELRQKLADKVAEMERSIRAETQRVKDAISQTGTGCGQKLADRCTAIKVDIQRSADETRKEVDTLERQGSSTLDHAERVAKSTIKQAGEDWKQQVNSHCESFEKSIANLGTVLKENYETKLASAAAQARHEITYLSEQAHERITATRNELEVELRDLEIDFVSQFESALRRLELVVSGHSSDKRNSGVARQLKAQKLRDQMQVHLNRWGSDIVDSVKDATSELELQFNRATDGFHARIESARTAAIELLERESKLMEKDIERTLKEFQKELSELDAQISQIEKAGQDAALTVIACSKAVLSL